MKNSFARVGVYPGSFDPVTIGHIDIAAHSAKMFDKLVIGVGENPAKNSLFTAQERVEMIEGDVETVLRPRLNEAGIDCVIVVESYRGLTTKFMQAHNSSISIRGMRGAKDFASEEEVAMVNADLFSHQTDASLSDKFTQVMIYTTDPLLIKVSSSTARELCKLSQDGALLKYVSPAVQKRLIERMEERGLRK